MRKTRKPNVTSEALAESAALKKAAEDATDKFDAIMRYCNKFTPKNCVDNSAPRGIKILKFNERFPPEIEYSSLICDDFQVSTYNGHTKVTTRDLINGFTNTLTQFSQTILTLDRLGNTPLRVFSDLGSYGDEVLGLVDEFDDENEERMSK